MWVVGVMFLLPFPAWQLMVSYITSVTVLTYGLGPIVLLVLRRNLPALRRPFRLKRAGIHRPRALSSAATDHLLDRVQDQHRPVRGRRPWASWSTPCSTMSIAQRPAAEFGWRNIAWLLPWFGGMWVISALGNIGGGSGVLGFWPGVVLVAVWSLIVIVFAMRCALPARRDRGDDGAPWRRSSDRRPRGRQPENSLPRGRIRAPVPKGPGRRDNDLLIQKIR